MFFNPLILVSDQDRISLYNINTRSGRQSMRIKRNISLYQILKTHIVRILFYFHSMPLALLSRVCCFETCNTCCASINQFSCLLSSYQTLIHFLMTTLYYQMGVRKTGSINRDSGIEIPEAWMPTIKKHKTGELCNSRLPRELITE